MQTVSRLTNLFTPERYVLSLRLNREERTFDGVVTLEGMANVANEFRLHSKELTIVSATVDGHQVTTTLHEHDELALTGQAISPGNHVVVVKFSGMITDGMHGLYPCYYTQDGMKKELLATQFESHHAREVFPCIDEPEGKATFSVTLTTEPGVTVLGNMPVRRQHQDPEGLVTEFDTTPRMSPYLLAWVTGDLQHISAKTKRGVDVSIWATHAQPANSLTFALDIAVRSIDFYEAYFGIDYPLPKSDHVALPDFSSGAMENWGLVTYRETALLADPNTTGISGRQMIATVIAHELAHQWFGNLVTMRWWNDLWLNESFANMMEYLATDRLEPSWGMWLEFSSNEAISALRRDSINGVQSVQVDVNHPDEINTLFDPSIVYAKGGRLLRMLHHYVGDAAFRAGLKEYFETYAYSNTEAADLWACLSNASGKDIGALMTPWISQPGYPVVHATLSSGTLSLTQEQFFVGPHQPSERLWPIPLESTSDAVPHLLETKAITVPIHDELVQLNSHDTAHFITHYDTLLWQRLLEKVSDGSLAEINRLQLLDEATLLARGGIIASARLIDFLQYYRHETSEPVWGLLFIALSELRKFVETDEDAEHALRRLSGQIAREQYERLGWQRKEGESDQDTKLRATVVSLMLYSEDAQALAYAKKLYETSALDQLEPELRAMILASVTRHGDATVVKQLLEAYQKTTSAELQNDICIGVTSTRLPEEIDHLLELIKDSTVIRPQDAAHWFVYLIRGRESRSAAWQWLQRNWQWVTETFRGDKSYDMYPRYSAGALSTKVQLEEYQRFFEPLKSQASLRRVITMGVSEIEGRVALIDKDGPAVRDALLKLQ